MVRLITQALATIWRPFQATGTAYTYEISDRGSENGVISSKTLKHFILRKSENTTKAVLQMKFYALTS